MSFEKERAIRDKWYEKQIELMRKDPKPYMDDNDISLFEGYLPTLKKDCQILEWGAGGSTIYFTKILNSFIDFTWEAIEHDVVWYVDLLKMNLENVRLHLFDEDVQRYDDRRALVGKPMTEYIKFPARLAKKYYCIFIDVTKRVSCLCESLNLLKKDGIILVHDAQRPEYKEGFDLFDGEWLSKTLWKGKLYQ